MSFDIQTIAQQYLINPNLSTIDLLLQSKYRSMIDLRDIYSVSTGTIITGSVSLLSNLNISGNAFFNYCSVWSTLYANNIILKGDTTINSNLYISNSSTINNLIVNNFHVLNNSIFNNININNNLIIPNNIIGKSNAIINSNLISNNKNNFNYLKANNINVIANTLVNKGNSNNLAIGGNSILQNTTTCISNINISGSTYFNNLTCLTNFYNKNLISQDITINSILYISNLSIFNKLKILKDTNVNNLNLMGQLNTNNFNLNGYTVCNLPEYPNNATAALAGVPYWGLYRTGNIVKVRLNINIPIATLNSSSVISLYLNEIYVDPGVTIIDSFSQAISPITLGTVDNTTAGIYNLIYYGIDKFNNYSNTVTRIVNVYNYPQISNIVLASNIITYTITGIYSNISYKIINQEVVIVTETPIINTSINIASLTLTSIPHYVIIYVKRDESNLVLTVTIAITNTNFGPALFIKGTNPLMVQLSMNYSVLNNVYGINLSNNSTITIQNSNLTVYNSSNALVTTTNGLLPTNYCDTFTITYNITGSNGVNITSIISIQTIDNIPPVLTLLGPSLKNLLSGSPYVDDGITAIDSIDNNLPVYMISLGTGISQLTQNVLTQNVLISGTSTLIDQTKNLPSGSYIATYKATDKNGNSAYSYRTIKISTKLTLAQMNNIISYSDSNTLTSNSWDNWSFNPDEWFVANNVLNRTAIGYGAMSYALSVSAVKTFIIIAKYYPIRRSVVVICDNTNFNPFISFDINKNSFYTNIYSGNYRVKIDNNPSVSDSQTTINFVDGNWHIIQITNLDLNMWIFPIRISSYPNFNMHQNSAIMFIATYNSVLSDTDMIFNYNILKSLIS